MTERRDPDPAIQDLTAHLADVLSRRHSTETWPYWIIHVLEILDNYLESKAPGLGDDILVRPLREDLDIRLEYGESQGGATDWCPVDGQFDFRR